MLTTVRERHAIIDAALRLSELGLNKGSAGNVSLRLADGFLITPSGLPAAELRAADIVFMLFDGTAEGARKPSSEWRFHRDVLAARPEVGAVVHTHAPFCTTLAVLGRGIPAFHYMVAVAGGDSIRCAPYATFGTQELSDHAVAALADRRACLLANHGMISVGRDLAAALALAVEVESLAEQYWRALQVGAPNVLPDDEMERVLEKFRTYGQAAGRD
ncbi:MAG: class II aldolase/adducin family protein [Rhodospirillales bacterium]|nr:class II aldolase/adducin family protein [Rhodospirillales bacterium]